MLKVKVEETKHKSLVILEGNRTDEEGKISDANFLNETTDMLSSDQQIDIIHEGSVKPTERDPDPYFKIKLNASLALRNIVKNNNKAIFNYWYVLFPTFMMRPQSEYIHYIQEMSNFSVQKEFIAKVFKEIKTKEPTLLYVIFQDNTQSNLKCSLMILLHQMIERSHISMPNF